VVFGVDGRFDKKSLQAFPSVTRVERVGERVIVYGQSDGLVGSVVNALEAGSVRFRDLRTEQPTLEDVFLALTGQEMRD
jgi:ABC-2 type transport system ATP-binding protein